MWRLLVFFSAFTAVFPIHVFHKEMLLTSSIRKLEAEFMHSSQRRTITQGLEDAIKAHKLMSFEKKIALCDFAASLKINSFYPNWTCTGATTTDMICMWKGITCRSGVIVKLELSTIGLKGSIPTSIGNLPSLSYLDLSSNKLIATIPESVAMLTNLVYLDLSYNHITSSIPSSIYKLNKLSYLKLNNNLLISSMHEKIGNLTNLQVLGLSSNSLTSLIPSNIGLLTNLIWLGFSRNQLSSYIPTSIGNLARLTFIKLSYNKLSSSIPTSIGMLSSVQKLFLSNNKLSSSIPTSIGLLSAVTALQLSYNKLIGSIPISIGNLQNIELFFAQNSLLSSSIPTSICSCTALNYVSLGVNFLTGSIPSCMGLLTDMILLLISHNSLSAVIPSSLGALVQLEQLSLHNNRLTSKVPTSLSQLPNLNVLDLANNLLTGADNCLCQIPLLTAIYLGNNYFTCQLICQTDGIWNLNATLPRCFDDQDVALYELETSLGVVKGQGRVVSTTEQEYTLPPYESLPSYVSIFLNDPNALEYYIEGQVALSAATTGNLLSLCLDQQCERVVKQFDPVVYPGCCIKFYVAVTVPYKQCFITIHNTYPGYGTYVFKVKTRSHTPSNWAFTQSPMGHVAAIRLCQDDWLGVSCHQGQVTALDLRGYALKGTLPTAIGLLTGLTSLDLSYNEISGSLVSSLGLLSNLDTLRLTINKLKGTIPLQLGNLSSLYFMDISYNFFSGSIPSVLYSLPSVLYNYMDGNAFKGEVPAEMCRVVMSSNATYSLTNNPYLTCYQDHCWSTARPSLRNVDSTLRMCSPTTSPTLFPTPFPSKAPVPLSESGISTGLVVGISIGGGVVLVLLVGVMAYFLVYRKYYSKRALERKVRLEALSNLPIHRMLLQGDADINEEKMMSCVRENMSTAILTDFDAQTVFDIIFRGKSVVTISAAVLRELLIPHLPIGDGISAITCEIWSTAVQQDADFVVDAVIAIIREYRSHIIQLTTATDSLGRICKDIASLRCRTAFHRVLCLHERYALKDGPPEHQTATSLVIFAFDTHGQITPMSNDRGLVALKFMRLRDHFLNEVQNRDEYYLSSNFIVPILHAYDGDSKDVDNVAFRVDAVSKGYSDYPFCIVMEAAALNLKRVIDQHFIAGHAWPVIRAMIDQLAVCLRHLHCNDLIHGDLKPANVLQAHVKLKLIDFDASVRVGENLGKKFSSCYIPPEMITEGPEGGLIVRSIVTDTPSYELLQAAPSYDMWALGCVMYLLCTGSMLFPGSIEDNIVDDSVMQDLFDWSDSFKERKLNAVVDRTARNLLSQLLNKDPDKRPSASRMLSHPFLMGTAPARLPGEKAMWDVFISYRVESDDYHAEVLYDECKKKGLKVWQDSKCLRAGQNWLFECCRALIGSSVVVCVLSRGAINHRVNAAHNFEKLNKQSPCDSLLLEWRLALEAKKHGMVETIVPVLVGDMDANAAYSNYIRSNCGPTAAADVTVDSVETAFRECLHREGLGMPFDETLTVKAVYDAVLSNHGKFVEGDLSTCVTAIATDITQMRSRSADRSTQRYKSNIQLKEENRDLKEENVHLKEEINLLRMQLQI